MDAEYWRSRWRDGRIGFHQGDVDRHLVTHFPPLARSVLDATPPPLALAPRVLVPLCGKSLDLTWLAAQGFHVTGVEIAPEACRACVEEQGLVPLGDTPAESARRCGAENAWTLPGDGPGTFDLVQADIFDLPPHAPGRDTGWDLVWDRAALIALPPDVRVHYAAHIRARVRPGGAMLLVTAEYDPSEKEGPPFSVLGDEVARLYPDAAIEELARVSGEQEKERFGLSAFSMAVRSIRTPAR